MNQLEFFPVQALWKILLVLFALTAGWLFLSLRDGYPHASALTPVHAYAVSFVATSFVYLWLASIILRKDIPLRVVWVGVVLSVLVKASFLVSQPIGSDDIYRYVWDGKVQHAGINPYAHPPNSTTLGHLASADLPRLVNHPDMKTIYFPVAQWLFALAYFMAGANVGGIKLLILCADAISIAGLVVLLSTHAIPIQRVLLFSLSPLAILQFGLDGHIDAVGIALLVWAFVMYGRGATLSAGILLGLSISIKPVALVLIPLLLIHHAPERKRWWLVAAPLLILGLEFLPYMSAHPFEALSTFAQHWTFNGPVFESVNSILRDNQLSRIVCAIGLIGILIPLYVRRTMLFGSLSLALLALLFFSPVVHPWYVGWLVAVLPLAPRWSGIVLAAGASLTSITVVDFVLTGVWKQHGWVLILEYLPPAVLAVREIVRGYPLETKVRTTELTT
ncbi:MAG: hypothetical protein HY966_06320 [Ignavibacteriales bacterium]|nr:hypothetical protein [Ignavibacteriales bacterium]